MNGQNFTSTATEDLGKLAFFNGNDLEKSITEEKNGYNADHLGNTRVVYQAEWDNSQNQVKYTLKGAYDYFPYGKILRKFVPGNGIERYLTTQHERDEETIAGNVDGTGLDNRGARFYDSDVARFLSLDPHATKYAGLSPFNYVLGNPIAYIDPDGKDAVLIVFPNYKIQTPIGKISGLGHAGVLLIDNKTGYTKYYEYGRYSTDDGTSGKVNSFAIPNVVIGKDGAPTRESLDKVLEFISDKAGQGGEIQGAYIKSDEFEAMNDYAKGKLEESNSKSDKYDKDREECSLTGNNCGTFGCDVVKQDEKVDEKAPSTFDPRPNSIIEEYQEEFTPVEYIPN